MRKCISGVMTAALWASIVQAETTKQSQNLEFPKAMKLASADVIVSIRPVLRPAIKGQHVSAEGNARFQAWLGAFRERAAAQGIEAATLDAALAGVAYDKEVIKRDRNQAEFSKGLCTLFRGYII